VRLKSSPDEARFERYRADENFQAAREAVDDSFTKISESALLNAPGLQPLRKQLLQDALKYYQRFAQRLGQEPGLQADLAATYVRLSKITSQIGTHDEALKFAQLARDTYESLVALQPANIGLRHELARSMAEIGLLHDEAGRREEAKTE
jgi:tetratricopeptide (TPR) repeat protein